MTSSQRLHVPQLCSPGKTKYSFAFPQIIVLFRACISQGSATLCGSSRTTQWYPHGPSKVVLSDAGLEATRQLMREGGGNEEQPGAHSRSMEPSL